MERSNKVVWSEGMFLSPQHFQQQDRYLERQALDFFQAIHGQLTGLTSLVIDKERLKIGKIAVVSAGGIFPDGTPFQFNVEKMFDIPATTLQKKVYLALPISRAGVVEMSDQAHSRYTIQEHHLFDANREQSDAISVHLGELSISLKLEGEDLNDYTLLAIAEVIEQKADGEILLNQAFIPQCLHADVSMYLMANLDDIHAQMAYRAQAISLRIQADAKSKSYQALLRDYMWLQALGTWQPKVALWLSDPALLTKYLYYECVAMCGQFNGLEGHLPIDAKPWNTHHQFALFSPLFARLQQLLREVSLDNVTELVWDKQLFLTRRLLRTRIDDRRLCQDGRFVLVVSASMGSAKLSDEFIRAAKLSGNSDIANIVRHSLSGIPLRHLPYAPSELKSRADAAYFELDTKSSLWQSLVKKEELIALYIDDRLGDAHVEFYVIR